MAHEIISITIANYLKNTHNKKLKVAKITKFDCNW